MGNRKLAAKQLAPPIPALVSWHGSQKLQGLLYPQNNMEL
jgi:hypothetical protein